MKLNPYLSQNIHSTNINQKFIVQPHIYLSAGHNNIHTQQTVLGYIGYIGYTWNIGYSLVHIVKY